MVCFLHKECSKVVFLSIQGMVTLEATLWDIESLENYFGRNLTIILEAFKFLCICVYLDLGVTVLVMQETAQ